jgi:hypothetical protein
MQYASKSGSSYYYTKLGMYRVSNHWGRLANSKWRLEPMQTESGSKLSRFCALEPLYPDNAIEELYYLEMNYVASSVNYQHKTILITMVKQYFVRVLKPLKKLNKLEICSI